MIKKSYILFCVLNFLSLTSFAFNFLDKNLQAYECSNEYEARSCNKCKIVKSVKVDFKINIETSSIIQQAFEDKKLISSHSLEKCKIVDKKNWECGKGRTSDYVSSSNDRQGMNNGIFYSYFESIVVLTGKNKNLGFNPVSSSYSCAK